MEHDVPFFWIIIHHQPIVISIIILTCYFQSISFPSYWKEIRLGITPRTSPIFVIIAELIMIPFHVEPWLKVIWAQTSCLKIIVNLQSRLALASKFLLQFIKCRNGVWCIISHCFYYFFFCCIFIDFDNFIDHINRSLFQTYDLYLIFWHF